MLILFKREFPFEDILSLWEVLWSQVGGANFHHYIAVAILNLHRQHIIREQLEFDGILAYMQSLSGNLDLPLVLHTAEKFYKKLNPSDDVD